MTEDKAIEEGLPPLMGFPQEKWDDPSSMVPFYTCVIGPFRIYVYCPGGAKVEGWCIERKVNDVKASAGGQFFTYGSETGNIVHMPYPDTLALMCVIRELTSESNAPESSEDATHPADTTDDVLAPHE
jgi:hypothetical protein